jgi:CRISPR system Cascade subunit CasC
MKLIELHILQSFPVSCLNRDDVGAPKTAIFGGATRARISSQCLKRAIREAARESTNTGAFKGSRTRKAADDLTTALVALGVSQETGRKTAEEVLHLFLAKELPKGKKNAKKTVEVDPEIGEEQTSTLLYFSPTEIGKIAQGIHVAMRKQADADAKALKDAAVKALGKGMPKDAADIAIFGRMVANASDVTLEGAGMFSHALSTHKCDNDLDFWTAVEDEKKAGDDAGAANMGTAEFTSACYYRYAALNLDLLFDADHLKTLAKEDRKAVVKAFLNATLLAVPGARRNSMNANTLPSFVLGIVKENGQPIQLINAFEKPVRPKDGLIENSIAELKKHNEALKKTWGIVHKVEVAIPDTSLDEFCTEIVKYVE